MDILVPLARPPWTGLGKKLESACRKALFDFKLLEGVDKVAIALSGGKDSLCLLYLLHAISGRGFGPFEIHAIHIAGEFSCGAGVDQSYLKAICRELNVNLEVRHVDQKLETLQCYTCSRKRRTVIFDVAKSLGCKTIAFGHHRDDSIQTLLMNLFHKGEFAAILPKLPMQNYGVCLIRPLIYIEEKDVKNFASQYGFARISCQCPIGQKSKRKDIERILKSIEDDFPNVRKNLSHSSFLYGSKKALNP